jgi:hypothetical protein
VKPVCFVPGCARVCARVCVCLCASRASECEGARVGEGDSRAAPFSRFAAARAGASAVGAHWSGGAEV